MKWEIWSVKEIVDSHFLSSHIQRTFAFSSFQTFQTFINSNLRLWINWFSLKSLRNLIDTKHSFWAVAPPTLKCFVLNRTSLILAMYASKCQWFPVPTWKRADMSMRVGQFLCSNFHAFRFINFVFASLLMRGFNAQQPSIRSVSNFPC